MLHTVVVVPILWLDKLMFLLSLEAIYSSAIAMEEAFPCMKNLARAVCFGGLIENVWHVKVCM